MKSFKPEFMQRADEFDVQIDCFSGGPEDATCVFLGQGPGEVETRRGVPFSGPSGKLLWSHANKYGFTDKSVYCTNVVKRQLSLRDGGKSIKADELRSWFELCKWELTQLRNVKYIFAMGNYALELLLPDCESGIMAMRGSVVDAMLDDGREVKVVCAFNPAYPLDTPRVEVMFAADMQRFAKVVDGKFTPYEVEALINPTYKQAMAFIRDLSKQKKPVSFDLEAINNETACWGLANDGHRAMCINFRDRARNRYSVQEEADILLAGQALCDSHRIVAQNGSFDSYWSWLRDGIRLRVWHDTMLAHHTLYPQLPHNLGYLTSQYTTHPYYKDDFENWKEGGDIDEFWRYNCKDAAITYKIHERLERELLEQKQYDFFHGHVMRAQPHLVQACVNGVQTDASVKEIIRKFCEADLELKKEEFYRLVEECTGIQGYEPNPGSWQQMQVLFFDHLKLKGKGRKTDDTNRKYMIKDSGTSPQAREMLVALDKYKEEQKFYGTYVNSRVGEDGRFRCEYKQAGVTNAPGRLSSTQLLDGEGGNMQNQPPRARGQFVADEGCEFGYFDLGQAEARVVGWRAGIEKWMEQFEQARIDGIYDAHRALASEMFNVPYDQVPVKDHDKDNKPTIRYVAKRCRHGLNYRMERERLAEVTGLPYHVAVKAFMLYHRITPELVPWWEFEENDFRKTKVKYNALGRRFRVLQRMDDDVLKSCVAFYPQSTIGDKITQVWYQAVEDDKWPTGNARVCIDVHDNLVLVSLPRYTKTALAICKKYAESPIPIENYRTKKVVPLIVPAECKISYPTMAVVKNDKLEFVENKKGKHRWSHMKVVNL